MGPRAAALQHELRVGPLNQLRHGPAPPPRLPFSILPLGGGVGERAGAASTLVDTLQRALLRLGVALGERIGIERVAAGGERAQGADAACNAFTHESVAFGDRKSTSLNSSH